MKDCFTSLWRHFRLYWDSNIRRRERESNKQKNMRERKNEWKAVLRLCEDILGYIEGGGACETDGEERKKNKKVRG